MSLDKKNRRDLILDLVCDLVGGCFYAVGIYTFAKTANFAPGGLSGLALIINYLWNLPIGITTLILNIPFILFSYKVVGKKFLLKSLKTMVFCTIFVDLVFPHFSPYSGNPLLAALFSGVFLGAGLALIYMRGSSSGGTDFLTMSIKTLFPHLSIGLVTMSIDLIVILLGWPVFGNIDAVLYGLIATFVTSTVIDKIMYGIGAGKLMIIITTKSREVAATIDEICARGSTAIRGTGTYTNTERQVLLCACSKSEVYKLHSAVYHTDPEAFIMITETSEVFGEGFTEPELPKTNPSKKE